jgi:hypothetical protein
MRIYHNLKTMRLASLVTCVFLLVSLSTTTVKSFTKSSLTHRSSSTSKKMAPTEDHDTASVPHPFCLLPGDPSLMLTTNVNLGAKKLEVMKGEHKFCFCDSDVA